MIIMMDARIVMIIIMVISSYGNIVYISRDLLFIVYISLKAFKKISIMTKLTKVSISSKGWRMGGAYWCKKKKFYNCAEESPSGHRVKN